MSRRDSRNRREFVLASSGAGLAASAFAKTESLALSGGPRAVTAPGAILTSLTKWPRYTAADKKALHDLIDTGDFYPELVR
ncbi:MAG: hypothetical protein HZB13_08255, partial [Acidobacteria bacterium]|nr:hypothetical protein [Acidobacteriota bacterium]